MPWKFFLEFVRNVFETLDTSVVWSSVDWSSVVKYLTALIELFYAKKYYISLCLGVCFG